MVTVNEDGKRMYKHPSGELVPSVTTALETVHEKNLMDWKLKRAIEAMWDIGWAEYSKEFVNDLMESVDETHGYNAKIGTWLHSIAEDMFTSIGEAEGAIAYPEELEQHWPTMKILERNLRTFMGAIASYDVVAIEKSVFGEIESWTGQPMKYAGTADIVLASDKFNILADFKTSYATYDTHCAQVAGYAYAWNQMAKTYEDIPRVQKLWVIRFGKTEKAKPYHIETLTKEDAVLALSLFQSALNTWHIRAGTWGQILSGD